MYVIPKTKDGIYQKIIRFIPKYCVKEQCFTRKKVDKVTVAKVCVPYDQQPVKGLSWFISFKMERCLWDGYGAVKAHVQITLAVSQFMMRFIF